jgi:hypothetical protein
MADLTGASLYAALSEHGSSGDIVHNSILEEFEELRPLARPHWPEVKAGG